MCFVGAKKVQMSNLVVIVEAEVVGWSIEMCIEEGLSRVEVESGCQGLVKSFITSS